MTARPFVSLVLDVQGGSDVREPATGTDIEMELSLAGVLAAVMKVDQVAPDAHFFDDLGADSLVMAHFCARVRKRADLPSVSIKDIYQYPSIHRLARSLAGAAPVTAPGGAVTPLEDGLARVLAEVLEREQVAIDAHFFDDLSADSLVMAHFCARVRKRADLPTVSMKDVYLHPSIRSLATSMAPAAGGDVPASLASVPTEGGSPVAAAGTPTTAVVHESPARSAGADQQEPATAFQFYLCGVLQVLCFIAYSYAAALVFMRGYDWIATGAGLFDDYLRAVVFGGAVFVGTSLLPIAAKWLLIGRWTSGQIQIWSLTYVRFWLVKTLIRANPLVLIFVGTPVYSMYLRALGAKIGPRVVILTRQTPVCTDLFTVGADSVIRKDAVLTGYRARAGVIETGPIALGRDVLICEAAVLDVGTSMQDGSELGHRSSLHEGQSVPGGQSWHGSPGQPAPASFRTVEPLPARPVWTVVYTLLQLLGVVFVRMPILVGVIALVTVLFPGIDELLSVGPVALTEWWFYADALIGSSVIFVAALVLSLLGATILPRLLNLALTPDRVYPVHGFHHSVHRAVARTSNNRFYNKLFGDSSYIVGYLRSVGYTLLGREQSGSNFGNTNKHDNPFLVTVGTGTMVADGLSLVNAEYSSSSFRVTRVTVGARNFLGNHITYPAQGKTGANCLLATKVMVPTDGRVRENVGLLGSPAFEIPRSVNRDATFDHLKEPSELPRHLAAKNRHNRRTIGLVLFLRWFSLLIVTVIGLTGAELHDRFGALSFAFSLVAVLLFTTCFGILVERVLLRFGSLSAQFCSIYDPYFWWHERLWKLSAQPRIFNGTPFKGAIWRLLGMQVGSRLFDDGAEIPERTLVSIGANCTLNATAGIQCHSQEDGAFKSDRTTIGSGCTVGVGALVHYGVTVADGVEIAPDSFVMKGEDVPAGVRWAGNPAVEVSVRPAEIPGTLAEPAALRPGNSRPGAGRHRRSPGRAPAHQLVGPAKRSSGRHQPAGGHALATGGRHSAR